MIPPLADVPERRDYGKSRRQVLHRVDQCHWKPPRIRPDPVELLVDASRDRLPELLPIKWARMLASPFGFFRGAVPLMAADLALLPTTGVTVFSEPRQHPGRLRAYSRAVCPGASPTIPKVSTWGP